MAQNLTQDPAIDVRRKRCIDEMQRCGRQVDVAGRKAQDQPLFDVWPGSDERRPVNESVPDYRPRSEPGSHARVKTGPTHSVD